MTTSEFSQVSSKKPIKPQKNHGASNNWFSYISDVPAPFTPLVGREQESKAVSTLLTQPLVRLLTLTGTGGIGKTRLALQVVPTLKSEFPDGCCFVSLASIESPDLIIPTLVQALKAQRGKKSSPFASLKNFLRDKLFLLVLDNFEHLVEATPLLLELLSSCSGLKMLVTSRAVLGVQGEYRFPLRPLELPDLKHLPHSEALSHIPAVALFVQRAQGVIPGFQLTRTNAKSIAEICTRLDGLPLAIELAAARIRVLSPQALLKYLKHRLQVLTSGGPDLPARQQTLHNTLSWSYNLLTAEDQWLFRHLAVFIDGCTLEAIEALYTASGDTTTRVLDRVASLLNKSLLQSVEEEGNGIRFLMLETIREYSLECLAACGELEQAKDDHAAYYAGFTEETEPALLGRPQSTETELLVREYGNASAALQWLLDHKEREGNIELSLRLAAAMGGVWLVKGLLKEGQSSLELALAASDTSKSPVSIKARANALYVLAWLVRWQGDDARSSTLFEESLALFRTLGNIGLEPHFFEHILAELSTRLGEETFAALRAEGQAVTPEQELMAEAEPTISTISPPVTYAAGLTARELEVLRLIAMGLTTKQIATQLVISSHTVNVHIQSIYQKLDIKSRSAATRYAIEHHLI